MSCPDKTGPRGPMGQKGETGETGSSGVAGIQGPQGTRGETGATGPQGRTGDVGSKGFQGDKGDDGAPGIIGAAGADGRNGTDGADGRPGEQGFPGVTGPKGEKGDIGANGVPGIQGLNGRYIYGSYVSLTGIGNSDAIGDETLLFTQAVVGNTLSNDGDELEFVIDAEYLQNDLVNLIFELDPSNRYVYAYQNTENDIRSIKVVVTRIDKVNQLWSIQDVCKDALNNIAIKTVETFTTTFDLTTPMTFNLFADNIALGADQVLLKKCTMFLNKLQ